MRDDRDQRHGDDPSANDVRPQSRNRPRRSAGVAATHHPQLPAAQRCLRDIEEPRRHDEHEGDQRIAHWVLVDAVERVEYLHGDNAAVLEDQRRAEVGERPDEHDRRAREIAGQHERERDALEQPPAACADVPPRFLQARINIRQGRRHVQVHDRIQVQHLHDDHARHAAAEPVNRLTDHPQRRENLIDRPAASEDLPHAHCADERRQHHRHEKQSVEERLAAEFAADHGERDRHGDKRRDEGDREAEVDAVEDDRPLLGVGHHQLEEDEREVSVHPDSVHEHMTEGIDQEDREEGRHGGKKDESCRGQVEFAEHGVAHNLMSPPAAQRPRARSPVSPSGPPPPWPCAPRTRRP